VPRPRASQDARDVRRAIKHARRWAAMLTVAFTLLAVLVGAGATERVDRLVSHLAGAIATPPLDIAASVITLLGQAEVTGPVALVLAFIWWRRRGWRGLVPLLLFAGVALEVVMKHVVPHPSPPHELSRNLQLLPFLKSASPSSFPSGHVLRATFLSALMLSRWAFWMVVVLMAVTRAYLNEHWASDVAGGFLLGLALAGVAAAVYGGPAPHE
jgi:membrane-associated phospholipid phosphatase